MFGLGPTELAVILVLALLVMGPKRIPELAANLGKAIRSFRRATRELRDQIDIDDEVRKPFEDLRSALRDDPPPPPRYDLLRPAAPAEPLQPAADPVAATGAEAGALPFDPAASAAVGAFSGDVFTEATPAVTEPPLSPAQPPPTPGKAQGEGPAR